MSGKQISFLVDVGASLAILNEYYSLLLPLYVSVVDMKGLIETLNKTSYVCLYFGDFTLLYSFPVLPNCTNPLLGKDFLHQLGDLSPSKLMIKSIRLHYPPVPIPGPFSPFPASFGQTYSIEYIPSCNCHPPSPVCISLKDYTEDTSVPSCHLSLGHRDLNQLLTSSFRLTSLFLLTHSRHTYTYCQKVRQLLLPGTRSKMY